MAFIPFAATVGSWLGGSAALGGAAIAGTAAAVGSTVASSVSAKKASKEAANAMSSMKPAPLPEPPKIDVGAEQAKAAASAQAQMDQRRKSIARNKTIFTNPLGIAGEAETIKKKLLGQ